MDPAHKDYYYYYYYDYYYYYYYYYCYYYYYYYDSFKIPSRFLQFKGDATPAWPSESQHNTTTSSFVLRQHNLNATTEQFFRRSKNASCQ